MKKLTTIILIILIIAALIWNIWIIFFKETPFAVSPPELEGNESESTEQLDIGRLKRIQSTARAGMETLSETEILLINGGGSLVLINTEQGTEKEIAVIPQYDEILSFQAKSQDRILLSINNSPLMPRSFHLFIPESKSWIELQGSISSASLSPTGEFFAAFSEENASLEIFNYISQELVSSFSLNLSDFEIFWLKEELILFLSKPSEGTQGAVLAFNIENNSLEILKEDFGLSTLSSPNGENLLYLTGSPLSNSVLALKTPELDQPLNFVSFPSKCSFAGENTIYCAVPANQDSTASYPDSYLQRAAHSSDSIRRLEIFASSVAETTVLRSNEQALPLDIIELELVGEYLYFINRYDNQLYQLSLE